MCWLMNSATKNNQKLTLANLGVKLGARVYLLTSTRKPCKTLNLRVATTSTLSTLTFSYLFRLEHEGRVLVPYSKRREKEAEDAIRCSGVRRRRVVRTVSKSHQGRAMPGKKICQWNSSMMSRCWRPDFCGDVFEGADFDVFVLCFCSPQRWHLRNRSESGRWCWMCFYLDIFEKMIFWETKDWRCCLQVCFQLNQSGLRLKVASPNGNKGLFFFSVRFATCLLSTQI